MLGRIVTILKRLVGYPSSPASEPVEVLASNNAKPLRAKSGQISKAAQAQSKPVQSKPKRKPKAAPSTKQAPSRKRVQKSAQAESGATGKPRKTPARRTRQHAE